MTAADFQTRGVTVLPGLISDHMIMALRTEFDRLADKYGNGPGQTAGIRDLFRRSDLVRTVATSTPVLNSIQGILAKARAVRALFFDKTQTATWPLPWHQDRVIAVAAPCPVAGFGKWTVKQDIHHAEPPVDMLKQMVTTRLHLDGADAHTGALHVLPEAQNSLMEPDALTALRDDPRTELLTVAPGDAVLMRPLTPHSSDKISRDVRRRVLHLEYAGFDLPAPLEWRDAA